MEGLEVLLKRMVVKLILELNWMKKSDVSLKNTLISNQDLGPIQAYGFTFDSNLEEVKRSDTSEGQFHCAVWTWERNRIRGWLFS